MPDIFGNKDTYRDISWEAESLYAIGRLSYASDIPVSAFPLRGGSILAFKLVLSDPVAVLTLTSRGKLSAQVHDFHLGSSKVAWSDIGNADFRIKQDNLAGDTYMRWLGGVYQIKKLGNSVVVYGDGGITLLTPQDRYFATKELSKSGLLCKTALAGSEKVHYYITQNRELYELAEGAVPKKVGYRRFITQLSNQVVLSFAEHLNELVISDEEKSYKLSEHGLCEFWPGVSGFASRFDEVLLFMPEDVSDEITEQSFVTDPFDCGVYGQKTLASVKVLAQTEAKVKVSLGVKPRPEADAPWVWTPKVLANFNNETWFGKVGFLFKVAVYIEGGQYANVQEIEYTYQLSDRRGVKSFKALVKGETS